jgi:hypothetical protein
MCAKAINKKVNRSASRKAKYVIVRCVNAGAHSGELVSLVGQTVVLKNSRRIWYWKGAASLSEIAVHGCAFPGQCKITLAVPRITLTEACEVIECLPAGERFLREVAPWSQL